jgi:3-oxoadipate enol-lactonase
VTDEHWTIELPAGLPPGQILPVPGRGEFFVRDSGGPGVPLMLLHGWMFAADLNWHPSYGPLAAAGYRVIAIDHRGHGRGLRTPAPFRLEDCAADAAAVVGELDCGPVIAVGYSMGGPIAALMARDHPERVRGAVFCATASNWRQPLMRAIWRAMGIVRLSLGLFDLQVWRSALRRWGAPDGPYTTWLASELSRGNARDLAEAGRELGRYDGRPWLGRLTAPSAVVVTTRDAAVPPREQRLLAALLGAPMFEVASDHLAVARAPDAFNRALLDALHHVHQAAVPDLAPAGAANR